MEYEKLSRLVDEWNDQRLDLFHLSKPTQDLEVEGVMRFYFCDDGVKTKCIRVSSTATTQAVIDALVDKFLPDLKMLTNPDYTLWEVHEGGEERRLDADEKPLLVQLNWHKDDKEGRFLLKKHGIFLPIQALKDHDRSTNIKRSNKRFSKREKKEEKGKKRNMDIIKVHEGMDQENMNASGLYKQVPTTTFTRTISNPEIVMKKRREKKIESKLKEIGHGGSLKIYGEDVFPERPYVSILVSARDRASQILKEALVKYHVREEEWNGFELVQVEIVGDNEHMGRSFTDLTVAGIPRRSETAVHPDDCPLLQLANASPDVQIFFTIRRRIAPTSHVYRDTPSHTPSNNSGVCLIALNDNARIPISEGVTEVGNDDNLHLFARHHIALSRVCRRHCVITLTHGIFTITPSSPDAFIAINDRRIDRTETVLDGQVIRLGMDHMFTLSFPSSTTQTFVNKNEAMVQSERRNDNALRNNSGAIECGEVAHVIPLSVSIDEKSIWNLLIEALSRSTEKSSFPLTSSFVIFIGLHSLSDRHSIGGEVITSLCTHLSHLCKDSCPSRDRLLYWLSNSSHLHYLLSSDICFSLSLHQLSSLIQSLFRSLVDECTRELNVVVASFFLPSHSSRGALVSTLDSILLSCRASQLNADITIQLASQLFSSLNATIFNEMIEMRCTSSVGETVCIGLSQLDEWATGMGVELAAECLFDTCRQAANLLVAPKNDMAAMGSTTYKLNSLQVRHLLTSFVVTGEESGVGNDALHRMIGLAERQADELTTQEGIPLSLLETDRLGGMDMIDPQEGYFTNRSLSHLEPLKIFLNELAIKGVCWNVMWNNGSIGWISDRLERVNPPSLLPLPSPTLESMTVNGGGTPVVKIHLNRGTGGIGLSIVAAQGVGESQCGIYIKKVLEGSVAANDGRMSAGDELMQVNDIPLRGMTQEQAARTLSSCGPVVRFVVRKDAASTNGLSPYLNSPLSATSTTRDDKGPPSTQLYTPFISKHNQNETHVTQSSQSAFSVPYKNARSISSSDLYHQHQVNDANTSFSGRSISSTTSNFSALPSHYKRPTVIQPNRNASPSPSTLRSGAVSPSILSHSSYRVQSPHSNRKGAISPTPLSHSTGSIQHVDLLPSPPLARSSPITQSHSINSFPPSFHSPSIQSMQSVAQSAASIAMNKKKDMSQRSPYYQSTANASISDLEGSLLRMNVEGEEGYGDWMKEREDRADRSENYSYNRRPMTTPTRRETLIDDVGDYDEVDSPSIVGAQEVYRDPRNRRIMDSSSYVTTHSSLDGSKLGFGDKMRFFARGIGESTPPTRITTSSAQRIIQDDM